MAKKLVADLMVDYLERRDVKYVFGLCGHTVIGMLDALSRSKKVKYISNRHESVASTAADGYARLTHKASVVMCHLGPGITNVITGVANAAFDSIPMVVIAGAQLLFRQAPPPGSEYARRCHPVSAFGAGGEAGMAGG